MICISGVPGTGKTTICTLLNRDGIKCESADKVARDLDCLNDDGVDVDILRDRFPSFEVVEGHYSHLLDCNAVIILFTDEEILRERLSKRNYDQEKIQQNVEAQISGTIYYESLDRVPSNRIFQLDTGKMGLDETYHAIRRIIQRFRTNNKS